MPRPRSTTKRPAPATGAETESLLGAKTTSQEENVDIVENAVPMIKVLNIRGQAIEGSGKTPNHPSPVYNPVTRTYIKAGDVGEIPKDLAKVFMRKGYVELAD